jgi:hypothetical protein
VYLVEKKTGRIEDDIKEGPTYGSAIGTVSKNSSINLPPLQQRARFH